MRLFFTFLFALLSAGHAFGQNTLGCTEPCATNYNPDATVDDGSCIFPEEPDVECWQTITFNDTTCIWDVTGTQPEVPMDLACWQTVIFNYTTCQWEVGAEDPFIPTDLEC